MSKPQEQSFPLVEVTWVDSMTHTGWRVQEEVLGQMHKPRILMHKSAGYLFEETDKYVAIAQSYNVLKDGCVANLVQIPKTAITQRRSLGKGGK